MHLRSRRLRATRSLRRVRVMAAPGAAEVAAPAPMAQVEARLARRCRPHLLTQV